MKPTLLLAFSDSPGDARRGGGAAAAAADDDDDDDWKAVESDSFASMNFAMRVAWDGGGGLCDKR